MKNNWDRILFKTKQNYNSRIELLFAQIEPRDQLHENFYINRMPIKCFVYFRPFHVYATHAAILDHNSIPVYIAYFLDAKANTSSIIWSRNGITSHLNYHLEWFIVTHVEILSMIQNVMQLLRNI